MASPVCTVNTSATAGGVNVSAASTVTIQLTDLSASTWSITCIGTDDSNSAPTLTVDQVTRTATFTSGAAGSAYIFRSQVNGGRDSNGAIDGSLTTTFGVYVLTAGGRRVLAFNETQEGNATHGWVAQLNSQIRALAGNAVTITDGGRERVYAVTNDAKAYSELWQVAGETGDATPTQIGLFAMPNNAIVSLTSDVVTTKSDGTAKYQQTVSAVFSSDGAGVVTELGAHTKSTAKTVGTTAGLSFDFVVSGSNVTVKATGRAAEFWRWSPRLVANVRTTAA